MLLTRGIDAFRHKFEGLSPPLSHHPTQNFIQKRSACISVNFPENAQLPQDQPSQTVARRQAS
ncbi:hypothetical protein GCM10023192_34750 [Amycolatopsis samaneae]